jgi:hypothetical protein
MADKTGNNRKTLQVNSQPENELGRKRAQIIGMNHRGPQRGRAATKLIRTHELMKTERGISRKTGNNRKRRQATSSPKRKQVEL